MPTTKKLPIVAAAFASYVAFFSGQLTVDRLLPIALNVPSVVVSAVALTVGFIIALYGVFRQNGVLSTFGTKYAIHVILYASLIIVSQIFLVVFSSAFGNPLQDASIVNDIILSIIQLLGLAIMICIWDRNYIMYLSWIAVFAGLSVGIWLFAYYSGPEHSPVMSVFTVYRVALFGGFAGLYLYFENKCPNIRYEKIIILLLTAFCFFTAFSTLSKAALLGGVASMLAMALIYALWINKGKAIISFLIIALSVLTFWALRGQVFTDRISEGIIGRGYSSMQAVDMVDLPQEFLDDSTEIAAINAQKNLAKHIVCSFEREGCNNPATKTEIALINGIFKNHVVLPDYSVRIRLATHALEGFVEHPYVGNGFGTYQLVTENLYTGDPEEYHYPHNFVLELLYAVGILGSAPIFLTLLICFCILVKDGNRMDSALPLIASAASGIVGASFGGDYSDFRIVWIYLMLSYAVYLGHKATTPEFGRAD